MKKEIWKNIPSYENLYMISDLGRIKSLKWGKEKILNPVEEKGYLKVTLHKDSKRKGFKIHQLVAMAFLDHEPNGMRSIIDHLNNIKTDNRLENLRIVTCRENLSKPEERKNKSSKYTGVTFHKPSGKWYSNIRINGKLKYLGIFTKEEEAARAYENALASLN